MRPNPWCVEEIPIFLSLIHIATAVHFCIIKPLNGLFIQSDTILLQDPTKDRISSGTPIVKISQGHYIYIGNVTAIDMTLPKWAIFTIGVYTSSIRKILIFRRIKQKFGFWSYIKWHTSWTFQLEIKFDKKSYCHISRCF